MIKTDIRNLSIAYASAATSPGEANAPVLTAARLLARWLKDETGRVVDVNALPPPGRPSPDQGFQIVVGVLDQPEIAVRLRFQQLETAFSPDGYALALRPDALYIYSNQPRGVVYGCGYELPKKTIFSGDEVSFDLGAADFLVQTPADRLRAWCNWKVDHDFLHLAAARYRLNTIWMDASVTSEVLLPADSALQPFIEPHAAAIKRLRADSDKAVVIAKSYGLETFIGGLNGIFVVPQYLYDGIIQAHPEMLARGFRGGSPYPPYEWQDRPVFCPSHPRTVQFYKDVVDEFLSAHPGTDGICMGVGYDGYPLGCGCERCQDYAYYDRFRDQVNWVYEVAVKKHHKKLWLWTWVCGTNSVLPGYEHYYGWVKEFAEANPESVYISSFATEADFLITHRPNPVIGSRGPNDMGMVLLWPEYRGDSVVPAWLLSWMEANLPLLRLRGACGFAGTDTISSRREQDLIQSAENYALSEMMWDHSVTAEQAALEYCKRKFGAQAAPIIAPALLLSGSAIAKTLFLPDGIRFSGHSHIENDLRVLWDIYTLYDSAPSFLDAQTRQKILRAGPPYQPKIEAASPGLKLTRKNIASIMAGKNEAVAEAAWMVTQVEKARPYLKPEHYEELSTRCQWLVGYARLFRGLAQAFFHLRRGASADSIQVRLGAEEMAAAMANLPQSGPPLPYDILATFGDYPWMITPPQELINALVAASILIEKGIQDQPVGIIDCEEAAGALDSLFLPYTRLSLPVDGSTGTDLANYRLLVLGPGAMKQLETAGSRRMYPAALARFVQEGGSLLLYNPGENWKALPTSWLPGKVETWVCNHTFVTVTAKTPVTAGYTTLKSEPIARFQATSAAVAEASHFSPFIKSFVVASNDWQTLTYPAVLAETTWGKGRIFIDLLPENRTILLRTLAYLIK
jgi:hypothetical protein